MECVTLIYCTLTHLSNNDLKLILESLECINQRQSMTLTPKNNVKKKMMVVEGGGGGRLSCLTNIQSDLKSPYLVKLMSEVNNNNSMKDTSHCIVSNKYEGKTCG